MRCDRGSAGTARTVAAAPFGDGGGPGRAGQGRAGPGRAQPSRGPPPSPPRLGLATPRRREPRGRLLPGSAGPDGNAARPGPRGARGRRGSGLTACGLLPLSARPAPVCRGNVSSEGAPTPSSPLSLVLRPRSMLQVWCNCGYSGLTYTLASPTWCFPDRCSRNAHGIQSQCSSAGCSIGMGSD